MSAQHRPSDQEPTARPSSRRRPGRIASMLDPAYALLGATGLAVGALRSLAERRRDAGLVSDAFLLRAMAASGWEPVLDCCVRCGVVGPHRAFHVASGGTVCVHCRPPGCATLSPGVAEHLEALMEGDWAAVAASSPAVVRQASGLAAAHLRWHLERDLRSLPFVEREAGGHGLVAAPETTQEAAHGGIPRVS